MQHKFGLVFHICNQWLVIKKEVFLFLCSSYHLSLPIKCTQYENIAVFVECECEQNEEMDLFFLETDSIKCIEH